MDEPSCGFMNEHCTKDESHTTSMTIAGTLALFLFCASVVTLSIYRKWKIELEIEGLLWKIEASEIRHFFNAEIVSSPSKVCNGRLYLWVYCLLFRFHVHSSVWPARNRLDRAARTRSSRKPPASGDWWYASRSWNSPDVRTYRGI